jgi:hypothetical protein
LLGKVNRRGGLGQGTQSSRQGWTGGLSGFGSVVAVGGICSPLICVSVACVAVTHQPIPQPPYAGSHMIPSPLFKAPPPPPDPALKLATFAIHVTDGESPHGPSIADPPVIALRASPMLSVADPLDLAVNTVTQLVGIVSVWVWAADSLRSPTADTIMSTLAPDVTDPGSGPVPDPVAAVATSVRVAASLLVHSPAAMDRVAPTLAVAVIVLAPDPTLFAWNSSITPWLLASVTRVPETAA